MQRAVLNENSGKRSFSFIEFCFDNTSFRRAVGICLEFQNIGNEKYGFKQVVYALSRFRADVYDGRRASPRFGNEVVFGKLLQYSVGLSARFVDFIYRDDNGYARGFGVIDCLDRLRHYTVVGRNDDYRYICNERAS